MFASWTWLKLFKETKKSCEFDQIIAKHVQHAVQKMSEEQKSHFFTLKNSGCQELGSSNKFLQE